MVSRLGKSAILALKSLKARNLHNPSSRGERGRCIVAAGGTHRPIFYNIAIWTRNDPLRKVGSRPRKIVGRHACPDQQLPARGRGD